MATTITSTDYRAAHLQRAMLQADRNSRKQQAGATLRRKAANQYKRYRRQLVAMGFCPDTPLDGGE